MDHTQEKPRGIRNNNPGNIMHSPLFWWFGELSPDGEGYARFMRPEDGIRAMAITLINYHRLHGCETLSQYITRWAPPETNDTKAYIADVSLRLMLPADYKVIVPNELDLLIIGIIHHENGQQPYSADLIDQGIRDARYHH